MPEPFTVVELTASETHHLRRRVLRDGIPSSDVTYTQDALATAWHLGVRRGAMLVGVSTWAPEPWPDAPTASAIRLRGMAVDQTEQGTGVGAILLAAGVDRARLTGAALVWATARDRVLGFYERCGFTRVGDGFVDPLTGLPHHRIVIALRP